MLRNVVLFQGTNANGQTGLWESDGTASGTFELAPIAGASASGISPTDLTAFSGAVFFEGSNPTPFETNEGLWTTDGTPDGTVELINDSDSFGPYTVNNLTVFNGQVLFEVTIHGSISPPNPTGLFYHLWTTNGTAAGTVELPIAGAGGSGSDFTVFNGRVLFEVTTTVAFIGGTVTALWTTDGTAAGTQELTGITGAASTGVNPTDMTVFNGEVLFGGENSSDQFGLWTTDGTAADTQEVTGIVGAASTGVSPTDITVFNGKALFDGFDTAGDQGLWMTDGTGAGTQELTGISGADPTGLNPTNMAVFNNEVLFNGVDTAGDRGLWVTDSTANGTHELTGIAGADPAGLDPTGFEEFNNAVLFNGLDTAGDPGLWVTDGTATGTHELTGIAGAARRDWTPLISLPPR
jgi:ELWxxDGT repeat protein